MARRRRRRGLSYLPSEPRRTPAIIYIALAALFLAGIFYSKQSLVKPLAGQILDAYTNQVITDSVKVILTNDSKLAHSAGVAVRQESMPDPNGFFHFDKVTDQYQLATETTARYRSANQSFSANYSPTLKLEPAFLQGVVHNAASNPIARANVILNDHLVQTGSEGDFIFGDAPVEGDITVKAIGYPRVITHFKQAVKVDVNLTPLRVKGVYLPTPVANDSYGLHNILNLLDTTEVNAVVLDIKDESGYISYDSKVPLATPAPTGKKINNLPGLLDQLHQHHAYVIGRLVLFQDPVLTDKKLDWTLRSRRTGQSWSDAAGYNWINPYNQDSWKFFIDLAKEAAGMGFDEIQFDYDRFPASGNLADIDYGQGSDQVGRLQGYS